MGEPELGYVSLIELQSVRGKLGLPSSAIGTSKPPSQFRLMQKRLANFGASSPKATSGASFEAPDFTWPLGEAAFIKAPKTFGYRMLD